MRDECEGSVIAARNDLKMHCKHRVGRCSVDLYHRPQGAESVSNCGTIRVVGVGLLKYRLDRALVWT